MTTAIDLITLALKDIGALGIGQSVSPDDTVDALATLNMMLDLWSADRLSVYHLIDVKRQATGALSYTIGPGGDFDAPRPSDIKSAFVRLTSGSTPVDYPLGIIRAREDYNLIAAKSINSLPDHVFLDSDYPLGNLYFYPVPNAQYELHVSVLAALPEFAAPAVKVILPPAYMAAIRYNLAIFLAPSYQLEPTPSLQRLAANAKRVIQRMNTQIPSMTMPAGVLGGGSRYSVTSDSYR